MGLKSRVDDLERRAASDGGERFLESPIIYRLGESPAETLARLGLTPEDIEGKFVVWLPDNQREEDDELQ